MGQLINILEPILSERKKTLENLLGGEIFSERQ